MPDPFTTWLAEQPIPDTLGGVEALARKAYEYGLEVGARIAPLPEPEPPPALSLADRLHRRSSAATPYVHPTDPDRVKFVDLDGDEPA